MVTAQPRARRSDLKGVAASPGRASGPVFVAQEAPGAQAPGAPTIEAAVEAVTGRLERLAAETAASNPEGAEILRAQAAMAGDPSLAAEVRAAAAAGTPLAEAMRKAAAVYAGRLESLDDPYLRERARDIKEVGRLLRLAVIGGTASRLANLTEPAIVFAHELSPADTLGVRRDLLLGLVTETGGPTSHAAIVARELGIPAVVDVPEAAEIAAGYPAAAIDGDSGEVRLLEHAGTQSSGAAAGRLDLSAMPVRIMANIGSVDSARAAAAAGAAGVGLFRTEFMFMSAQGPMEEDAQLDVYSEVCELMAPHPVVVRTLDAGADKPLPYLDTETEPNPQLGRRGVRLWLHRESLWRPQVRALVRASADHQNLRVMLPMVAARTEMMLARRLFDSQAADLGLSPPSLGMMVEIPGVAAALDAFEGVADFVSLGTNDLTQYTLAADREQQWGGELSELNPGVLRLIATAVETANELGIDAGVCGEMAGRPEGAVFLVGIGVGSLSMAVSAMPRVLSVLSSVGTEGCRAAARSALETKTARSALRVLSRGITEAPAG